MSKKAEQEWMLTTVSGEKIVRVEIVNEGHGIKYYTVPELKSEKAQIQPSFEEMFPIVDIENVSLEGNEQAEIKGTQEYIEKYFPIVKASTLSLKDEFLKHNPTTYQYQQGIFKKALISAIKSGLSDFRAQRMDACFDKKGNICFKAGMKPALGESPLWWDKNAKKFMPEKGSRLGTKNERIAFLGLLIKYLIEKKGYTVSNAWKAVCDESQYLGHYIDSENAKGDYEDTGSRQVGEWYDLSNTYKIIVDDEVGGFLSVGGDYRRTGRSNPLADDHYKLEYPQFKVYDATGWLVLSVLH